VSLHRFICEVLVFHDGLGLKIMMSTVPIAMFSTSMHPRSQDVIKGVP
jgi:hypothetical protein